MSPTDTSNPPRLPVTSPSRTAEDGRPATHCPIGPEPCSAAHANPTGGGNPFIREMRLDRCIHQLFEEQAGRTPDTVAVICGTLQLTYGELEGHANQWAHELMAAGVGPNIHVAVGLHRSVELIIALLASLKAGGTYVPLDPNYPPARLAVMLGDTAPRVLVTEEKLRTRLPRSDALVLCMDRDGARVGTRPTTRPPRAVVPDSIAYVIYTSGSTGTPKGIPLPHATLVNLITWQQPIPQPGRVAQFSSASFDVSLQEIFFALGSGKTLVIVDQAARTQPESLARFLRTHEISDLFIPNIVLHNLAHAVEEEDRTIPTLANVYQAGEPLTISPAVRRFFRKHPACRLHNHYGPAESHVVTALVLPADPDTWPPRPSIGKPIANTRIHILDEHRQPVPQGTAGEIHVAGVGLARGYLNRPSLTALRFVPDPFAGQHDTTMYQTGDLGRLLEDGSIEFLGRLDDQVKIRGFRVEPGEIEAVLREHPSVRETAVAARGDDPDTRRLVAYVTPRSPAVPDSQSLRDFLHQRIPEFMMPAAFVLLEQLPRTPAGKIDRNALPAPEAAGTAIPAGAAPKGDLETQLAGIWSELLPVTNVRRDDNFFELGGHSLLASRMVARIRRQVGVDIPLRLLFDSPTIAELAAAILARQAQSLDADALERLLLALESMPEENAQVTPGAATAPRHDPASKTLDP